MVEIDVTNIGPYERNNNIRAVPPIKLNKCVACCWTIYDLFKAFFNEMKFMNVNISKVYK